MDAYIFVATFIFCVGLAGALITFNRGQGSGTLMISVMITLAMIIWGAVLLLT